jgi:hypothetical protein
MGIDHKRDLGVVVVRRRMIEGFELFIFAGYGVSIKLSVRPECPEASIGVHSTFIFCKETDYLEHLK